MNNTEIEKILQSNGFSDYKIIDPQKDIELAQWVRYKCMYGCTKYGQCGCCPPVVPSVDECRKMIQEYKSAIILHFSIQSQTKDEKQQIMDNSLSLEREIFLAGYYKAFLLSYISCEFCEKCATAESRVPCYKSRPRPEAMGIDVFQTARNAGYAIEVITSKDTTVDRFSFVLVE